MKNIFETVVKDEPKFKSESSLNHVAPGICPKCKNPMIVANACEEPVHFCTTCRVTEPLPL